MKMIKVMVGQDHGLSVLFFRFSSSIFTLEAPGDIPLVSPWLLAGERWTSLPRMAVQYQHFLIKHNVCLLFFLLVQFYLDGPSRWLHTTIAWQPTLVLLFAFCSSQMNGKLGWHAWADSTRHPTSPLLAQYSILLFHFYCWMRIRFLLLLLQLLAGGSRSAISLTYSLRTHRQALCTWNYCGWRALCVHMAANAVAG